jgi:hypothetical protein
MTGEIARKERPNIKYVLNTTGTCLGGFDTKLNRFVTVAAQIRPGEWVSTPNELLIDDKPVDTNITHLCNYQNSYGECKPNTHEIFARNCFTFAKIFKGSITFLDGPNFGGLNL